MDKMLQAQQPQIEHQHIIRKSSEPGVINDELVKSQLRAHGYGDELAPLGRNATIDYATITELNLDFQNILHIDNLWMCFGLTKLSLKCNKLTKIQNLDNLQCLRELDLSFNNIERIENLECLQSLEYLTLYKNDIRRIENLHLSNLVRLNLGSNFIDSIDGIETLRDKDKLFSLNLQGNPICDKFNDNGGFRLFIAAYLPNLRNKLRALEDREMEQIIMRQRLLQCAELALMSSESFVEHLDDHQLFEELFSENVESNDGRVQTNDDTYKQEYQKRIYRATQDVYRLGVECRDQRIAEIKLFDDALAHGRKEVQRRAIQLVNSFSNVTTAIATTTDATSMTMATTTITTTTAATTPADNESTQDSSLYANNDIEKHHRQCHNVLDERYEAPLDSVWYALMEMETTLHERTTESKTIFIATISQIIENFIGKCSELFECIRTACEYYFQSIKSTDGHGIGDAMTKVHHMNIIDMRMDKIQSLAYKWLSKLIDQYEQTEYNRNRNRIMEINAVVETDQANFNQLNS